MKRHVRDRLCGLLRAGGLTGLLLRRRRGAAVLCYHRVHDRKDPLRPGLPPARLAEHLSWLGKRFRVTTAAEVARAPGSLPGRRVAVTFDDGTPDVLTGALPTLRDAGVAATLFAVTGTRVTWTERVHRIPGIDVVATKRRLKGVDPRTRDREIDGLAADHGERAEGEDLLAPGELGTWRDGGGDVGAHTRTHPILPHCSDEVVREEVAGSRRDLEEALGEPPELFAYPGGAWDDRTAAVVAEAGFRAAFATGGGWVTDASPRFALPRIDVRPNATVAVLAAEMAGVLPRAAEVEAMSSIDIRPVAAADLEEVVRFRASVEGGEYLRALRDAAYYRWKYLGSGGAVAMGAFHGTRLMGLLSGQPRIVRAADATILVADLGEIFVDPAARGRGVFRLLHDELVTILARRDVEAMCCRPAKKAGEMLRGGFGYERALTIAVGEHRIRGDRTPRPSPGVDIVLETSTGADYDGLDADLASGATMTVRSAAWLAHRYLENPTPYALLALRRGRRLEGWIVVVAVVRPDRGPDGYLVDSLLWPEPTVRRSAVAAALRWFADQGCRRAFAWRANGPQDPPVLTDPRPLSRLRKLDVVIRPVRPAGRALLRAPARNRWTFRMGDTDGI